MVKLFETCHLAIKWQSRFEYLTQTHFQFFQSLNYFCLAFRMKAPNLDETKTYNEVSLLFSTIHLGCRKVDLDVLETSCDKKCCWELAFL